MPVFATPDEARSYILSKVEQGMTCEQKFGFEGIEVFCRFAVEREATPRERKVVIPSKPERQEVFKVQQNIELPYELRSYQKQAVDFALQHRHVIIELPTGRGKTLTALGIVNALMQITPRRTLVIVPTQLLLQQWINDGFKAAGISATGVSSEGKQWGEHTVTTYQSAIRNLHLLASYDLIIFDEVHHLFSPEYRKILFALENKPYLIGLTATIREYGEGKELQHAYFPNIYTRTIEEFQSGESKIPVMVDMIPVEFVDDEREQYDYDQRVITKANRTIGPVPEWPKYVNSYDEALKRLSRAAISAYADQKRLLTETPDKLKEIVRIIQRTPGQFIVFTDTIDSITAIESALRNAGISEGSIYSGVKSLERARIINGLRDGTIRVLVGGSAITEGLDIPDISNAIMASMLVKSSRTYVQRVGRILRPKPGKRVKLFLIYVRNTLEEDNAKKVRDMVGGETYGLPS